MYASVQIEISRRVRLSEELNTDFARDLGNSIAKILS